MGEKAHSKESISWVCILTVFEKYLWPSAKLSNVAFVSVKGSVVVAGFASLAQTMTTANSRIADRRTGQCRSFSIIVHDLC